MAVLLPLLAACGGEAMPPGGTEDASVDTTAAAGLPRFVEVTAASGVDFVHNTGAFGEKWLPETMGSGVVLFDQNGDGRLDILFLNGTRFEGRPGESTTQAFYRNLGEWHFEEATAEVGLDFEAYCLGGAAADVDNDGDTDLYVSCLGRDRLLIDEGGRFVDRSAAAGLRQGYEFGVSVAIFDADRDGWLDILATRYVTWTPETDLFCTLDGKTKSYCTPESYAGASPRYLHNGGDGTFEDRTEAAGFFAPTAKSLGVSVLDLDDDGWLDVAIANDTQPNLLFHNLGNGTFEEVGVPSGMAFSDTGAARGGMGIDAADYDRSGRQSLVIGNFANEMVALFRPREESLFVDVAPISALGRDTLLSLTFATFFFDFDLDGWLDLLIANGHLDPQVETVQTKVTYRQPAQLFRNTGDGHFVEMSPRVAGDLAEPRVARGGAYGDLDGDGDLDLVLSTNGGPAALFDNRGEHGRWLAVDLRGTRSNRDALGAVVTIESGGATQSWLVRTGSSYLSQSQVEPVFGLGAAESVDRVSVAWPSGDRTERHDIEPDRMIRIAEDG